MAMTPVPPGYRGLWQRTLLEASVTQVEGGICRWLRKVDYQPPTGANDIGRMQFESANRVIEHGVEAEYLENWERLPASVGGRAFPASRSRSLCGERARRSRWGDIPLSLVFSPFWAITI